mmetsp:Transcript_23268/g.38467  ORF Transcript_23268/g.38467 Transcript_23268/m.38467 type:complete len:106 (-) Transcript_23268:57-374(-)
MARAPTEYTTFVNASNCDERRQCTNPPLVVDVPSRGKASHDEARGDAGCGGAAAVAASETAAKANEDEALVSGQPCCCFSCLQRLKLQEHENDVVVPIVSALDHL